MSENNTLKTRIVIRNDTVANWTANNPVLLKGELGIETDTNRFKIGDGVKKFSELPYSPEIDASAVTLTKDITATYTFGKYSPDSTGSVTIPGEGKTLEEFLQNALAEEKNPVITQPSVSISMSNAGAKEVGTRIAPTYSVSFNAGKYSYGPATGVTATYSVTDGATTKTTATGSFNELTVEPSTSYRLTVTATHTAGVNPKTNLGTEKASLAIAAGSKTASSAAITGFRGWFCGYFSANSALADPTKITSAQIRAFGVRNGNFVSTMDTNQMKQMFFAAPQGLVKSVKVANAVNGAPQTVLKTSVNVEGANGYTAVAYDVFYVSNAAAESGASKFSITVSK